MHLCGGAHCTFGVVLVCGWCAEDGHDPVTGELVDATTHLDGGAAGLERSGEIAGRDHRGAWLVLMGHVDLLAGLPDAGPRRFLRGSATSGNI